MMGITRKRRSGLVLVFAVSLVLAQAAVALGAKPGTQASQFDANDYYVVTFKDKPVVTYDGGVRNYRATTPERGQGFDAHSPQSEAYADYLRGVHGDYVRWLQKQAPQVEVARDLVYASNAIAVKLNGADPKLLSQGPGAKYTAKSDLYRPTMNTSVDLVNVAAAWDEVGRDNAGTGVKVGVIDSGVYGGHPFFECKGVASQQYFVSGDTTGNAEQAKWGLPPGDYYYAFDHGTHVGGTIGGCVTADGLDGIELLPTSRTEMSGVAPGVELHDYNVFPGFGAGFVAYGGSAFSHDIAAAIDAALEEGVHVINMSLGGGVQGPHDFLAEAVNAASEVAVVVVSAGNEGNGGVGDYATVGSPGTAAGAVTVGASTNDRSIGFPIVVNGNEYRAAEGDFDPLDIDAPGQPLVLWPEQANVDNDPELEGLACTGTNADLSGSVVLIDRGVCAFSTKVANAHAAGAIGVVVANNIPGDGPIAMSGSGDIPAVGISYEDGQAIRGLTTPWTITSDPDALQEYDEIENQIASFSSRGPTAFTYLVKPDLVAPGVNIRSSVFPPGLWAQFQGTSMAAPHVSGGAAIVIAAIGADDDLDGYIDHGSYDPKEVKGRLVASSTRIDGLDAESVLARGNGLMDVSGAVDQLVWADPVSVSFGKVVGGRGFEGSVDVTLSAGCTFTGASGDGDAWISFDGSTVLLDAGRDATGQYEGDLTVACGMETFTMPYWFEADTRGSR